MSKLLLLLVLVGFSSASDVVVKTEKGSMKGARKDLEHGKHYFAFTGIRYAQAPTGKLRFKVGWIAWMCNRNTVVPTVLVHESYVALGARLGHNFQQRQWQQH